MNKLKYTLIFFVLAVIIYPVSSRIINEYATEVCEPYNNSANVCHLNITPHARFSYCDGKWENISDTVNIKLENGLLQIDSCGKEADYIIFTEDKGLRDYKTEDMVLTVHKKQNGLSFDINFSSFPIDSRLGFELVDGNIKTEGAKHILGNTEIDWADAEKLGYEVLQVTDAEIIYDEPPMKDGKVFFDPTVTIDYSSGLMEDTFLDNIAPNTNWGLSGDLDIGNDTSPLYDQHAIFKINNSYCSNTNVLSASLKVFKVGNGNSFDITAFNISCNQYTNLSNITYNNYADYCTGKSYMDTQERPYASDEYWEPYNVTNAFLANQTAYIFMEAEYNHQGDMKSIEYYDTAYRPYITLTYISSGNITINATNSRTGLPISSFNVSINGTYNFTTSDGQLETNLSYSLNPLNLTIIAAQYELFSLVNTSIIEPTTYSIEESSVQVMLIDERTGNLFDVANVSAAMIYSDDDGTAYNLKTGGGYANISITNNSNFRLEIIWYDGTMITNYFNAQLFSDTSLRLCANRDDVSYFSQYLVSNSERVALLKSIYANCYAVADYTRFAYDDYLILRAPTIQTYYVLTVMDDDGAMVQLASIDGSVESTVNIDNLLFLQTNYDLIGNNDYLSVSPYYVDGAIVANYTLISYINYDYDNLNFTITITLLDNNTILYTANEVTDDYTLLFPYGAYTVTNTSAFRINITVTNPHGTQSFYKTYSLYPNVQDRLDSRVAFVLALIILLFGITAASSRTALGWLGLLVCIGALIVLSLAAQTYYILYLTGLLAIAFIYIALQMKDQNPLVP